MKHCKRNTTLQYLLLNNLTGRKALLPSWADVEATIIEISHHLTTLNIPHVACPHYGCIVGTDGAVIVDCVVTMSHYNTP